MRLDMAAVSVSLDGVADAHLKAATLAVDIDKREVITAAGAVPYDRLVLAPGGVFKRMQSPREDSLARRKGRLHQASAVPRSVGDAVSGHDRVAAAI